LLTNKETASASEHFTLIMKKFDYTIQIGGFTAGGLGFSHRSFQLLNGWAYHMPTSLCLTTEGQSLENIGIEPDINIRNYENEIFDGYDHIFEYAIIYIKR